MISSVQGERGSLLVNSLVEEYVSQCLSSPGSMAFEVGIQMDWYLTQGGSNNNPSRLMLSKWR